MTLFIQKIKSFIGNDSHKCRDENIALDIFCILKGSHRPRVSNLSMTGLKLVKMGPNFN